MTTVNCFCCEALNLEEYLVFSTLNNLHLKENQSREVTLLLDVDCLKLSVS
jgi:hypothetical protein